MNIANKFLRKFTEELILNSAPIYILEKIEDKKRQEFRNNINLELEPRIEIRNNELKINKNIKESEDLEESEELITEDGINKIKPLIKDPSITKIECIGPEKYLIINKGFEINSIKITLDKNEINSILDYFSNETKIPRTGGVFKAILGNLIITAIDSEFGGPRFIITKIYSKDSEFF